MNIHTLRRAALIGLAVVLLADFLLSPWPQDRTGLGVGVLAMSAIGACLAAMLLMPEAFGTLMQNRDLLTPLALVVVGSKLIGWATVVPVIGGFLQPALPLSLLNFGLSLSLAILLQIALTVAYTTWMTVVLLEFRWSGQSDPCRVLPAVPVRFWRVAGLELIGWFPVMATALSLMPLMAVAPLLCLALMAILGVTWNLATAAVLLVATEGTAGVWPSFCAGVAVSWTHRRRWSALLLAQLFLLGLIYFYYRSEFGNTNSSWGINVFWTGGYMNDSRWYEKLAEAAHAVRLPLVDTLLKLLLGAFAVAIKLAILQRLPSGLAPETAPTEVRQ